MELDYKKKYSSFYGEIPNDWDVKLLPEVFDYIHGKAHEQHIDSSGAFTVVNSKFISSEGKVSKQSSNNFCPAKKGDILTVLSDLPNGKALAKTYYVNVNMKYAVNQRICIWRSKKDYPLFLSYIMNRHKYFMKFDDGVTQTHILNHHIEKCPVLVPSDIKEQKSIATALTDVDELISGLEKLISKKKDIKQGAMQQLLTPKESWHRRKLKDLAKYRRGSFPQPYGLSKWYDDVSGTPFVQVVDVDDNKKLKAETKQKISVEGAKRSVFVKKGTIILTIQGSIGRICITQYDAYVDRTLLIFESLLEDFNKYFFMISVWLKFRIEKENAPGGIIKTITKEALSNFEISYPKREEQDVIANILSDMDEEITQLKTKKEKYQSIKQGMMQELLTGKTRLL